MNELRECSQIVCPLRDPDKGCVISSSMKPSVRWLLLQKLLGIYKPTNTEMLGCGAIIEPKDYGSGPTNTLYFTNIIGEPVFLANVQQMNCCQQPSDSRKEEQPNKTTQLDMSGVRLQ
jgi:hypothetical protein